MHVDAPQRRQREDRRRNDLAVGDRNDDVRPQGPQRVQDRGIVQPGGLQHSEAQRAGDRSDRRRRDLPAAASRAVWLGHHRQHLDHIEHGPQGRDRKLGRAEEDGLQTSRWAIGS